MPPLNNQETLDVIIDFGVTHAISYTGKKNIPLTPDAVVGTTTRIPRRRKSGVTFYEVVKARKTIHVADFTAEELRTCWYSSKDLREMKRDVRYEAKIFADDVEEVSYYIAGATTPTTSSVVIRGLDMFTPSGSRRRWESKQRSILTVLEEQRLQREEGSHDPEFIAQIYEGASGSSRLAAIEAAHK